MSTHNKIKLIFRPLFRPFSIFYTEQILVALIYILCAKMPRVCQSHEISWKEYSLFDDLNIFIYKIVKWNVVDFDVRKCNIYTRNAIEHCKYFWKCYKQGYIFTLISAFILLLLHIKIIKEWIFRKILHILN